MKIKISKHGYQRNGISGEGFFYFLFTSLESRYDRDLIVQKEIQMIATLTVENENPEEFNGSCRVITPDNLDLHWRGDVFENEIRKMYKKWYLGRGQNE